MCRAKGEGGHRCRMSATVNARRTLVQRLGRREAAGNHAGAAADREVLAGLDAARARYGNVVTPMVLPVPETVAEVFAPVRSAGLRPLVVGGSVRDALMDGRAPKDVDVEVYGGTLDEVVAVLSAGGYRVDEVGRAFGVLKVLLADGTDLDVSVPRRDNHVGAGHRGFTVEADASMSVAEAAARRDFTINALGFDPEYGVCVDPYQGRADLEAGVLRATSEAFAEDPLRVLRGFQFAARYGLRLDPETAQVCRGLVGRAGELPVERVRGEWEKFYVKGGHPERGLEALAQTGWDATIPGLAQANTPEGRSRVAAAADLAVADGVNEATRARLVAATLASGMDENDARALMQTTLTGADQQRSAFWLSRARFPTTDAGDATVRGWAATLGARQVSVREWARLEAVTGDRGLAERVLSAAVRLGCAEGPQPDLVLGRDIIARFPDRHPGPWTGQVQRAARQAQVDGVFATREQAERWLASYRLPDLDDARR